MIIFWISAVPSPISSIGDIAVEALDLVLLGVAVAAVDAEGVLDDLLAVLAGEVLGHAGLEVVRSPESFLRAAITIIWWAASTLVPISASLNCDRLVLAIGLPKACRCCA